MNRYLSSVASAVAGVVSGCSDAAPIGVAPVPSTDAQEVAVVEIPCVSELVDLSKVVPLGSVDDPYSDRPVDFPCNPEGLQFEELGGEPVFSIETGACAYTTAVAPLTTALSAGDTIEARVWHFALLGPNAAAHVSVRVGDAVVLDERVDIPGESGMSLASVTLDGPHATGTPVYFHLHNHGANSWSWLGLRRTACSAR